MLLKKPAIALLLVISSITLLAAIPVGAGQECVDKIMSTCSKCHYPARICEKLGKKSKREWKTTIKRMLRYGLVLNDSEQESMLRCLLTLEGNSGNLCK